MKRSDRTTPVGLFNYARSYWLSGSALHLRRLKVTHAHAPVTFLFYHAIELYLKAFLRAHGTSLRTIRKLGHDVKAITRAAGDLYLMDEDREVLAIMAETDAVIRSRYIETGFFTRATEESLDRTCRSLDQTIGVALRKAGFSVRPTPPN